MSLIFPLLQLQVLHPQFTTTTTTPLNHYVTQPQYVYHSPSVFAEHELIQRHDVSSLELEGRYTSPRVFFDDDSLDESREIRLEEQLREERLRQLQTPLGSPIREVRRYEKSVEGDLDYSEDKRIKLSRKRRNADAETTPGTKDDATGSEEIEERRRFQPHYASSGASSRPFQTNQQQTRPGNHRGQPLDSSQRPGSPSRLTFQRPGTTSTRRPRVQNTRSDPNFILEGQGLYGGYKGSFGGQKGKTSPR